MQATGQFTKLKVLVACEYSGVVRDAFTARGHHAVSCDLLPSESPGGYHYQGDVRDILTLGWDLMICHPDCTYVCGSGLHWNNRGRGWEKTYEAIKFAKTLWEAPIPKIALENPVGLLSRHIGKPTQYIQPYEFGEDASKKTCLWLKGLPPLAPTNYFPPRITPDGKCRWGNQTDSGQNKLGPSEDRWKLRAKTYQGWANAMAEQWG